MAYDSARISFQSLVSFLRCVGRRRAHAAPVTVKSYESGDVVITSGVEEGAKVVALGVQKLDPGQKVQVLSAPSF